jgi:hypothetical protein
MVSFLSAAHGPMEDQPRPEQLTPQNRFRCLQRGKTRGRRTQHLTTAVSLPRSRREIVSRRSWLGSGAEAGGRESLCSDPRGGTARSRPRPLEDGPRPVIFWLREQALWEYNHL